LNPETSNFFVLRAFLKYWLPVLVWMALIFTASSDSHSYQHSSRLIEPLLHWLFPSMSQENVGRIHEAARKCCHLTEYAIFALLLWRALSQSKNGLSAWSAKKIGAVLLIVFIYAGSDEFHQIFVPTRTPHFTDVLIDTGGGTIGLFVLWIFQRRRRPKPQQ
jgi:VanZ family protein